jgi:hypothetical protein
MADPLTDEARVAQATNELTARRTLLRVLEDIEESAVAYGKAFPENFLGLREPGMSLVVVFDEHDQTVVFGVRDAAGKRHVCHAVCVDRNVEVFGRALDAVLRSTLDAVPQSTEPKPPMH